MEIKNKIMDLLDSIAGLDQRIAEIQERNPAVTANSSENEFLSQLILELDSRKKSLRNLKMLYNQRMLSKLVTRGIQDDETNEWWHSRY